MCFALAGKHFNIPQSINERSYERKWISGRAITSELLKNEATHKGCA